MQRYPEYIFRDAQYAETQRYLGHRDAEMPRMQRSRERGRAPATTNTCGFGLHTLTPGASSKENLGLEVDMGTTDGFHILHIMCLQKPSLPYCAKFPHDFKSWTELI